MTDRSRRKRRRWHFALLSGGAASTIAGATLAVSLPDISSRWRIICLVVGAGLSGILAIVERARANYEKPRGSDTVFQLSPDVADFTDRGKIIAEVKRLLLAKRRWWRRLFSPPAVPIVVISGQPGVGKSALAVHIAHQLRRAFHDAQLHVNLRGADETPLDSHITLGQLLIGLGIEPSIVPDTPQGRSQRLRDELAGRNSLLVLDNAADEAQVRPLLPGDDHAAVLITSRRPLPGLEGAAQVRLDVLEPAQALIMLEKVARRGGLRDQRGAKDVLERCGFLPLALRIAGGKLAVRSDMSLSTLAANLSDERRRIAMTLGDLEVRASLALTYGRLESSVARAFRLLAMLDVADFPAAIIPPLLGLTPDPAGDSWETKADEIIEKLFDAQLIELAGIGANEQARYRFHDLIRVFARTCLDTDETGTRSGKRWRGRSARTRHGSCIATIGWLRAMCTGPHPCQSSRSPTARCAAGSRSVRNNGSSTSGRRYSG